MDSFQGAPTAQEAKWVIGRTSVLNERAGQCLR